MKLKEWITVYTEDGCKMILKQPINLQFPNDLPDLFKTYMLYHKTTDDEYDFFKGDYTTDYVFNIFSDAMTPCCEHYIESNKNFDEVSDGIYNGVKLFCTKFGIPNSIDINYMENLTRFLHDFIYKSLDF